jgi:hypothetical protein
MERGFSLAHPESFIEIYDLRRFPTSLRGLAVFEISQSEASLLDSGRASHHHFYDLTARYISSRTQT